MTNFRLAPFGILLLFFFVQNSLNYLFYPNAPLLLLLVVLYYSLSDGAFLGALLGLWAGLLMDLFGLGRLGFWMIGLSISGFVSGSISKKIFPDSLFTKIILSLLFFYGLNFFNLLKISASDKSMRLPGIFFDAFLLWPMLTTALSSVWVFFILSHTTHTRKRRSF